MSSQPGGRFPLRRRDPGWGGHPLSRRPIDAGAWMLPLGIEGVKRTLIFGLAGARSFGRVSAEGQSVARRTGVDWGRAEFVLVGLGFLGFITLLIRLTTVYSGLPAHPLFVHVPVILIPVTVVAAIVFMARPEWLGRYGIALALASIVAMSSVFLAMQAGGALEGALHLKGEAAHLISEHSQAAHILAIVYTAFTGLLIVAFAALRISQGRPTGLAIVDRPLAPPAVFATLRVLVVVLALVAGFFTFRTGDLGAKAVWAGRLQAASKR
jgi:hypothetical protein